MNITEIINWSLFSVLGLTGLAVLISYLKSDSIVRPGKRRTPLTQHPDNFKLAHETIDFPTADGVTLKGWFIPAASGETDKTIILCHGWGVNRGDLLRDTYFLAEKGFNLFYFDFRASGESGGSLSSVGYLETRDFDAAYEFLKSHRPHAAEHVAVLGSSMGASVAIFAAAKYPEIKCVLAENAFLSYTKVITNWSWMRSKVPYFPLVPLTLAFARKKLGADPEPFSPAYNIDKVTMPIMIINGDHDDIVPLRDAEELFGLAKSPKKQMWVINGATHGKCAEVGGEVYKNKVIQFFTENLL